MESTENQDNQHEARAMYRRAIRFVAFEPWPSRFAVIVSICAAFPVVMGMLVLARWIAVGLDIQVVNQSGRYGGPQIWFMIDNLVMIGDNNNIALTHFVVMAGLGLSWAILFWMGEFLAGRSAARTGERLRLAGFHQALRLGHHSGVPADLAHLLDRGVEAVQVALRRSLSGLPRALTGLFLAMAGALVLSPWFALASVAASCLAWGLGRGCLSLSRHYVRLEEDGLKGTLKRMESTVHDMAAIKAQGLEPLVRENIEIELATAAGHQVASRGYSTMGRAAATVLTGAVLLGWLSLGIWLVCHGNVGLADFFFLGLCQPAMAHWFLALSRSRDAEHRAALAARGLFHFLDQRGKVRQVPGAHTPGPLTQGLEFDHVSVRQNGKSLVRSASLVVPAGKRVALVGADNDELRCLLSLPNRLTDPDKGEIRWDGVNLKLCRLESLRMGIGWVVSPFVVVGGTVIANIIGGRPGTSESEAEAVCRSTHLDRLARTLPEGLSTQVGPGGISLQPLQAYLIALSRALLGNPSLLILEEPDFELNTDERALVDDALNRAIEGRAVLLLARTAARLLACDHIFLIEHGHVSMHGSHENLLAKSAVYRHFYEHTLDGLHSAGKQKS